MFPFEHGTRFDEMEKPLYDVCVGLLAGEAKYVMMGGFRFLLKNELDVVKEKVINIRCNDCDELIESVHVCRPIAKQYNEASKLWKGLGKVPYSIHLIDSGLYDAIHYDYGDGIKVYVYDKGKKRIRERKPRLSKTKMFGRRPKKMKCKHVISDVFLEQ